MPSAPAGKAFIFPPSQCQPLERYLPQHNADSSRIFATVTYAASLDSQLSVRRGVSTAISGPQSLAMTHYLRSRHDAILIGVGTAVVDDPSLNCRLEGVGGYGGEGLNGQPRPVIIDPAGRWDFSEQRKSFGLARDGRGRGPWIVTSVEPGKEKVRVLEACGGRVILMQRKDGQRGFRWDEILQRLQEEGIKSVMIEGGAGVLTSILSRKYAKLVDSVIVTVAPVYLGVGGVVVSPDKPEDGADALLPVTRLEDVSWVPLGEDVVLCGVPMRRDEDDVA